MGIWILWASPFFFFLFSFIFRFCFAKNCSSSVMQIRIRDNIPYNCSDTYQRCLELYQQVWWGLCPSSCLSGSLRRRSKPDISTLALCSESDSKLDKNHLMDLLYYNTVNLYTLYEKYYLFQFLSFLSFLSFSTDNNEKNDIKWKKISFFIYDI